MRDAQSTILLGVERHAVRRMSVWRYFLHSLPDSRDESDRLGSAFTKIVAWILKGGWRRFSTTSPRLNLYRDDHVTHSLFAVNKRSLVTSPMNRKPESWE